MKNGIPVVNPRESWALESDNLGAYFMAECHIAKHCGLVVYMAFSHEVLAITLFLILNLLNP